MERGIKNLVPIWTLIPKKHRDAVFSSVSLMHYTKAYKEVFNTTSTHKKIRTAIHELESNNEIVIILKFSKDWKFQSSVYINTSYIFHDSYASISTAYVILIPVSKRYDPIEGEKHRKKLIRERSKLRKKYNIKYLSSIKKTAMAYFLKGLDKRRNELNHQLVEHIQDGKFDYTIPNAVNVRNIAFNKHDMGELLHIQQNIQRLMNNAEKSINGYVTKSVLHPVLSTLYYDEPCTAHIEFDIRDEATNNRLKLQDIYDHVLENRYKGDYFSLNREILNRSYVFGKHYISHKSKFNCVTDQKEVFKFILKNT